MRIKLRDIAERANVSQATVSRVINKNPNVDERTRTTILNVMQQIGYSTHDVDVPATRESQFVITIGTRSLGGATTRSDDSSAVRDPNPAASDLDRLVSAGVEAITRSTETRLRVERIAFDAPSQAEMQQLLEADGIIVVGGMVSDAFIESLEKSHKPFVVVGAHLTTREVNCVLGDYVNGVAQAVTTLADFGHERIAFINGPSITTTSHDKLAGYVLGLYQAGLGRDERLIVAAMDFDPRAGYSATRELLLRSRHFSAILYGSDLMAVGGLRALKEAGLRVPEQVSVVGFYNDAISQYLDPPLTTIHLDRQRLGEIAARRLMTMLVQPDTERLRIVIPTKLIMRASVAVANTL